MVHLGNNIAKLRGFRRLPQKDIASRLDISQQDYSKLEGKEQIDDDLLERIAQILDFPVDLIKHMDTGASALSVNQQGGNTGNVFYQYAEQQEENIFELYKNLLKEKDNLLAVKDKIIQQKDDIIQMYQKQQKAS